MARTDAIVLGAGIVGTSIALQLDDLTSLIAASQ
jgi:L-2-hydroxyglutarate oxidase LhgO